MKGTLSLLLIVILFSCNSTRKVERALLEGDYYSAINMALNQIQKGRDNAKTEDQKVILQKAFEKYQDSQLEKIDFLTESPSPHQEEIYETYNDLYATQRDIEPVLPLYHRNKKLKFKFEDITTQLLEAKRNYAEYLYQSAKSFMNNGDVMSYRTAYDTFDQLQRLIPDYKDTNRLMVKSAELGTNYVFVQLFNDSEIAIPKALEEDILNFNTYGLEDQWTVYHANKSDGKPYNYNIDLKFQSIIFSPERIVEKEVPVSKQIEITENQKDRDGNIIRDSEGQPLTYTRNETVNGIMNTISQEKLVSIVANVDYYDNSTNQKMNSYKLNSQFLFANNFATFEGDRKALSDDQLALLVGQAVPFPSNEQMLYDAAEDIKNKLQAILKRHNFN